MTDHSLTAVILWEQMLASAGMVRSGERLGPDNELAWHLGRAVVDYVDQYGQAAARQLVLGLAPIVSDLHSNFYQAHQNEDDYAAWLWRFISQLCVLSEGISVISPLAQVLACAHACGNVDTVPELSDTPDLRVFRCSRKMWREDADGVLHAVEFDAETAGEEDGFWVVYGYDFAGTGHPLAEVADGDFIDGESMAALIAECLSQRAPRPDIANAAATY